ncbi:MAG: (d)CMP kinase [Candidatus Cryptobacteroides sp.]
MHIPDIKIAVDGYSSTGKSSFAKLIAKEFSFLYLDSGALYRAVTLFAIRNGLTGENGYVDAALSSLLPEVNVSFRNADDGSHTYLGEECVDQAIRTIEVSSYVSPVAVIPEVRDFVDRILREYGNAGRVVMDGRDIGTTVFPDAELKIFMIADVNVRAMRRLKEMRASGSDADLETVLDNLKTRDYIDSHRETSPLRQAGDAIVLDNTNMTLEDQMVWLKDILRQKFGD